MGRKKAALSGRLADVDLRLLEVFIAVVDAGGISAAQVSLNLANSTISNHLADLEKRLDMRLCERGRSGFALTAQGREVYLAAGELQLALDAFRQRLNQTHQQVSGHLHLCLAEHMLGVHNSMVVDVLRRFSELAPQVKVRITNLSSDEVAEAVLDKQVDLGMTVMPQGFDGLDSQVLFSEQMKLYCGRGHPLFDADLSDFSAEQLCDYKFVESPRLLVGREAHPDMRLWPKHARAHHQEARAALVLSGHYLGLLPSHLVTGWGLEGDMRELFNDRYNYTNHFCALWRRSSVNNPVIELFIRCLSDSAHE